MAGEERRRSQRVIIRVPITMVVAENGRNVEISAHTVAVNVHGAMVVCPRSLDPLKTRLQPGEWPDAGENCFQGHALSPREFRGISYTRGIRFAVTHLLADFISSHQLEGPGRLVVASGSRRPQPSRLEASGSMPGAMSPRAHAISPLLKCLQTRQHHGFL